MATPTRMAAQMTNQSLVLLTTASASATQRSALSTTTTSAHSVLITIPLLIHLMTHLSPPHSLKKKCINSVNLLESVMTIPTLSLIAFVLVERTDRLDVVPKTEMTMETLTLLSMWTLTVTQGSPVAILTPIRHSPTLTLIPS